MTLRSEERKLGGGQSTPLSTLPSRHSVKPSSPDYDRVVLEHMKRKVVTDPATGCWLWQGFVAPSVVIRGKTVQRGYGFVGYRGNNWAVHRVMWIITNGAIPAGMHVCHTCDVRRCCNPAHLWLGTNQQNIADMTAKGHGICGQRKYATHCKHGHEFTPENTLMHNNGRWRQCKTCQAIRQASPRYKLKNAEAQRKRKARIRAARIAQQVSA